jgi:hypothetical protein
MYYSKELHIPGVRHISFKEFATAAEVKQAVTWLQALDSGFFYALVPRWFKCINVDSYNLTWA